MGLDMYLNKRHFIGNKFRKSKDLVKVIVPKNQEDVTFPVGEIKNSRITEITEEVAYWRKANAIHGWFVENVQDGKDDCGDYEVSREKLGELLAICEKVLKGSKLVDASIRNGQMGTKDGVKDIIEKGKTIENPEMAMRFLPTTSGFFYGGHDYDQYYLEDVKNTIEILTNVLKEKKGDFYYGSSW